MPEPPEGLLPPREIVLRLLASWRFGNDDAARAKFLEQPPSDLAITTDELGPLIVKQARARKLERVLYIEERCEEIPVMTEGLQFLATHEAETRRLKETTCRARMKRTDEARLRRQLKALGEDQTS